jgi:uncharacterized membrane protein
LARPEVQGALRPASARVAPPRPGEASIWALIAFAVIGVGIAAYLTTLHYAGVAPVCATSGVFNCEEVLTSSYSVIPGTSVPVTVPGMLWFMVSAGLAAASLVRGRRGVPEPRWLRPAHAAWGAVGMIAVFYFIHGEVALGAICEWCTGVHILVFLSLLVTLARLRPAAAPEPADLE